MSKPYDVAITCGVFDMLHQGHAELFAKMREMAGMVVVIVHDDLSTWKNKGKMPVQSCSHRMSNISRLYVADMLYAVEDADPGKRIDGIVDVLNMTGTKRMVYVRGDDWKDFPGRDMVERLGIDIEFKPYTKGISSTQRRSEL
jgi:cytidyltransferase-like protein